MEEGRTMSEYNRSGYFSRCAARVEAAKAKGAARVEADKAKAAARVKAGGKKSA